MGRSQQRRQVVDRSNSEEEPVPREDCWVGESKPFPVLWFALVVALAVLLALVSFLPPLQDAPLVSYLVQVVGVGLCIASAIALWQSHGSYNSTLDLLRSTVRQMDEMVKESSTLVSRARDCGLRMVHRPRGADESSREREGYRQVVAELTKAVNSPRDVQTIRMMGITLSEYFNEDENNVMHRVLESDHLALQVLVIDPTCVHAVVRTYHEVQAGFSIDSYPESPLVLGYLQSKGFLKRCRPKDKVRCYRAAPSAYIVFVNNSVFVESYFCGKVQSRSNKGGGRVPMLEYQKGSSAYEQIDYHFRAIWDAAREDLPEHTALTLEWADSVAKEFLEEVDPHRVLYPDVNRGD
jgi:hypothetical protein